MFLSGGELLISCLALSVSSEQQAAFDETQVAILSEEVNKQSMSVKNTFILYKPNLQ
jgi:hypothetical protein